MKQINRFRLYKLGQKNCHLKEILKVKGNASSDSAGLIAAIADQVAKLEPKSGTPIVSLQSDNR